MQLKDYLPNIILVLGVIFITLYFYHRLSNNEGFSDIDNAIMVAKNSTKDTPPTDDQMAGFYKSFLLYIKGDFSKGLAYVYDLNKRVYGTYSRVNDDFDPRRLLDDYKNPITGL